MNAVAGLQREIANGSAREQFAADLLDRLWAQYRQRVSYVQTYEKVVAQHAARFFNDHIALRTLSCQIPFTGIATLGRIFEALGWRPAGTYQFPDKQLSSIHFEPPHPELPKVFISELQLWALPAATREILLRSLHSHRLPVSDETLAKIADVESMGAAERQTLLERLVREFHELPWSLPEKSDVLAVNRVSQFAAWVLLHGYNVNHFTSLINSHDVESLNDIEKTSAALAAAGVPMKAEIEGERGSKLRQTATEAVVIDVDVAENGLQSRMPWTYAYFELAERGQLFNPATGVAHRFEGFLGPQAAQLFEMTRKT